jgi:hypothetical protein
VQLLKFRSYLDIQTGEKLAGITNLHQLCFGDVSQCRGSGMKAPCWPLSPQVVPLCCRSCNARACSPAIHMEELSEAARVADNCCRVGG